MKSAQQVAATLMYTHSLQILHLWYQNPLSETDANGQTTDACLFPH